jgi:hypothetical protein
MIARYEEACTTYMAEMRELMAEALRRELPLWRQAKALEWIVNHMANWLDSNADTLHELHTWIEVEERNTIARQN